MRSVLFTSILLWGVSSVLAVPPSQTLEDRLEAADAELIALEVRRRGDPKRGALVFYTSAAGCVRCHQSDSDTSPLGPNLAKINEGLESRVSDVYLVQSLLHPSHSIRKGYETTQILTSDGGVVSGLIVKETDAEVVVRNVTDLQKDQRIAIQNIEEREVSKVSLMPDGLMAALRSEREFLDLVSYVMAVAEGGIARAKALKPSAEQLVTRDDTANLDHAKILQNIKPRDLKRGQQIYEASCMQCHGLDGNKPSLATARAFGSQKLKYGADPYRMFMTLSRGNGLMAAATDLSPQERYQVVSYIREQFMKGKNPDYVPMDDAYLKSLPKGKEMGELKLPADRDYGPALASQLGNSVSSALTIKIGEKTIAYNLHTLDQAGVWREGFLDVDQTQHKRHRGEGYAQPQGVPVAALAGWRWGHAGTLDYPQEDLLSRGPLPEKWLDYHGHYLHDDSIVLSYAIDGRDIFEVPQAIPGVDAVRHLLYIGAGKELVLAAASGTESVEPTSKFGSDGISAMVGYRGTNESLGYSAARLFGNIVGATCEVDQKHRVVVRIPADDQPRAIEIVCMASQERGELEKLLHLEKSAVDLKAMVRGGKPRWPDTFETIGYRGFQSGAYAVDTITLPESTPYNTWFRTSAIDFFPDGRLVVATVGGDVWIVSGVDEDLLNLRWKRFAGGMYEPFGIKVVDGLIYVTCKDRLTRLHDYNHDGEADFYESFSPDSDVSTFFHAFNFDLHTDKQGNFYYAKAGQYTDYKLPGAIIKVSPDGKTRSVVCTGFRTPNGMGILPDDRLTVSDNQGNWMPASKVSLVKEGGFYGYVQTKASRGWAPDGGKIDHNKVLPPNTFDQPLIWMPQNVDNSSGGQVWVDDPRFGPLAGRLLHTSFGQGSLFYLMTQVVDGISQAALVKFPHEFGTGIMRGRVSPADGQVYVTGLNGWNENGRVGLADGGIYRVRYTGKPIRMISHCSVMPDGLHIDFNFPLDRSAAEDTTAYEVEQWNYQWSGDYGSQYYHPETGDIGKQRLEIERVTLSNDGRSLTLHASKLRPVHQLHLRLTLNDASGSPFQEEVYWTIHAIPAKPVLKSAR